jgi:hypothetical protein
MNKEIKSRWSIRKLTIIYLLSALIAFGLFSGTDPLCELRYILYTIISAAFWIRVIIAKRMHDQTNSDTLWLFLILIAPPAIYLIGIADLIW